MLPTNMESSLTVPSIGTILNAQATGEAPPKQVPSQPEPATQQEAKTERNLVLVCVCVRTYDNHSVCMCYTDIQLTVPLICRLQHKTCPRGMA